LGKKLGITPQISYDIQEVRLIFQGISLEKYKKEIQSHIYSSQYINQGQESIEEIEKRMFIFLNRVVRKHKNEKILVVSHGDPIIIISAKIEGKVFNEEYKRKNYLKTGEWLKLEYDHEKKHWKRVLS